MPRDSIASKYRYTPPPSKEDGDDRRTPRSAQRRRQSELGIGLFRQASAEASAARRQRAPTISAVEREYEEAEKLGFKMGKRLTVLCQMEGTRELGRNGFFARCKGRIRSISDDGREVSIGVVFDDGTKVLYSLEKLLRFTCARGGELCECVLDWDPPYGDSDGISIRSGEAIVLVCDEVDADGAKWWGFNGRPRQGWFPMECVRDCGFSLGEEVRFSDRGRHARRGEALLLPSGDVEVRFGGDADDALRCTIGEARAMAYRAEHSRELAEHRRP